MHIAEGFLPPVHCAVWFAASAPFVVHGARAVVRITRQDPNRRLVLAAAGALTLLLSAIKLPSVSGSSSHPTGTGLGAVALRPPVMAFLSTVVLLFQALLLAHGGLTTLGANVFAMGIVGPWAGYAAYRGVGAAFRLAGGSAGSGSPRNPRTAIAAGVFAAMAIADLATYATTAAQLALAYPDPSTGYLGALAKFAGVFGVTQIPLAIAEGILGVLVYRQLVRFGEDGRSPEWWGMPAAEAPSETAARS